MLLYIFEVKILLLILYSLKSSDFIFKFSLKDNLLDLLDELDYLCVLRINKLSLTEYFLCKLLTIPTISFP